MSKHYLDLQIIPLNLVTFFTSFIVPEAGTKVVGAKADGACQSSKTALPVPSYIFGFAKNPDVVTYYAVKGEAKYVGLLNPFKDAQITLKAYALAMPFGGRIGPRFFNISNSDITPRSGARALSRPFISGIQAPSGEYVAGQPIPSSADFWVLNKDDVVGGVPTAGAQVKFAIPNMFFDVESGKDLKSHEDHFKGEALEPLKVQPLADSVELYTAGKPSEAMGLYQKKQFSQLQSFLGPITGTVSALQIDYALYKVRGPTYFDANNYMIPLVEDPAGNGLNTESVGMTTGVQALGVKDYPGVYTYQIYAPLFGENLNYENPDAIFGTLKDYLTANSWAIDSFLIALDKVAQGIKKASNSGDAYKTIHSGDKNMPPGADADPSGTNPACKELSLAQKFFHFLSGTKEQILCGITPLHVAMREYYAKQLAGANPNFASYYTGSYYINPDKDKLALMSAYFPSSRQGADGDDAKTATNPHPLGIAGPDAGVPPISKRNSYSVKLVQMQNAIGGNPEQTSIHRKIFYENGVATSDMETFGIISTFENGLSKSDLSEFGSELFF